MYCGTEASAFGKQCSNHWGRRIISYELAPAIHSNDLGISFVYVKINRKLAISVLAEYILSVIHLF